MSKTPAADGTRRPSFPVRAALGGFNLAARSVRHLVLRTRAARKAAYYRMRGTQAGNAALRSAEIALAPLDSWRRRRMVEQFGSLGQLMESRDGYRDLAVADLPGVDRVVATCRTIFEEKVTASERLDATHAPGSDAEPRATPLQQKRRFLRNLLANDDLHRHVDLVDFALSDAALGLAARYLGAVPYLCRVDLLYSVPRESEEKVASQLFHADPEGLTQVKFFLNVFEIGDAEGPFTFIPADESARILREIRALRRRQGKAHVGRYLDSEIAAVGGTASIRSVKGPAGAGVAVDTSRCLHMGSRVQPGAFRLCFYVQYCTSRQASNVFDAERYRGDAIRYMAVAHSARSGQAHVTAPHEMNA
jgi:hypothetical protein